MNTASPIFDPKSFDKDTLRAAVGTAKFLPSPLKTGLVVGALGAIVGAMFGRSPLKWGLVAGGVTFGTTLAADTAFSLGIGMGAASCVDVTKQMFATQGWWPEHEHGREREREHEPWHPHHHHQPWGFGHQQWGHPHQQFHRAWHEEVLAPPPITYGPASDQAQAEVYSHGGLQ